MRKVCVRLTSLWLVALLGGSAGVGAESPGPPAVPAEARVTGGPRTQLPSMSDALPSQESTATSRVGRMAIPVGAGNALNPRANGPAQPPARQGQPSPEHTADSTAPGVTLTGVIGAALQANPDLRSATERIRIADATLDRARAEFFPKLSLSEAFLDTNIAAFAFVLELNQRRFNLGENLDHPGFVGNLSTLVTFQQSIYAGGRRTAEANSANEQRWSRCSALAAARNELRVPGG